MCDVASSMTSVAESGGGPYHHHHDEFVPHVSVPVTYGDIPYTKTLPMVVGRNRQSVCHGGTMVCDILWHLFKLRQEALVVERTSGSKDTDGEMQATRATVVWHRTMYYLNHLKSCMDVLEGAGMANDVLCMDCTHCIHAPRSPVYLAMHWLLPDALDLMVSATTHPEEVINRHAHCPDMGEPMATYHPMVFLARHPPLQDQERATIQHVVDVARRYGMRFDLRSALILLKNSQYQVMEPVFASYAGWDDEHVPMLREMHHKLRELQDQTYPATPEERMAFLDRKETLALLGRVLTHNG
jgi:hypothetical protein